MSDKPNDQNKPQYVYPFDPTGLPVWVWGLLLGLLFLLFVIGVYYASKGPGPGPQISARQAQLTGGVLKTPGAV